MSGVSSKPVILGACAVFATASVYLGVQSHRIQAENDALRAQAVALASVSGGEREKALLAEKERELAAARLRMAELDGRLKKREGLAAPAVGEEADLAGLAAEREKIEKFLNAAASPKRPDDPPVRVGYRQFVAGGFTAELDAAEIAYLKTISDQSGDPDLGLALASFLKGQERIEQLKALAAQNPESIRAQLALAKAALRESGSPELFESALRELKRLDPQNALPLYLEAERRLSEGKDAEALAAFSVAAQRGDYQGYKGSELVGKEELLRRGGYSVGPRRGIAFLNDAMDLSALGGDKSFALKLIEQGKTLEQAGRGEEAAGLYRAVDLFGQRRGSEERSMIGELMSLAIRGKALEHLRDWHTSRGRADLVQEAQASIDALKQRSALCKETQKKTSEDIETYMGRTVGSEDAMALYFETVLRSGELAAMRAALGAK